MKTSETIKQMITEAHERGISNVYRLQLNQVQQLRNEVYSQNANETDNGFKLFIRNNKNTGKVYIYLCDRNGENDPLLSIAELLFPVMAELSLIAANKTITPANNYKLLNHLCNSMNKNERLTYSWNEIKAVIDVDEAIS